MPKNIYITARRLVSTVSQNATNNFLREKIFNLLIELYEKQEGVKIKYSLVKKGEEKEDGYKVNS